MQGLHAEIGTTTLSRILVHRQTALRGRKVAAKGNALGELPTGYSMRPFRGRAGLLKKTEHTQRCSMRHDGNGCTPAQLRKTARGKCLLEKRAGATVPLAHEQQLQFGLGKE